MFASVALLESQKVWTPPAVKPLDEGVWQAWLAKGLLLYNPVVPSFSFSGEWQSALVVASAVPFVASLAWRNARMEPDA